MLYTVLYDIIGEYANILNLEYFIDNNETLAYICDDCGCHFYYLKEDNKMIYELDLFDNHILRHATDATSMQMQDYLTLTALNVRLCKYKKINKVFCGMCAYHVNKQSLELNYCEYGLANYISMKHCNFIKLNKCFFSNDYISDIHIVLRRYDYYFRNDEEELQIRSLVLDNDKNLIRELSRNPVFKITRMVIEDIFRINFLYLDKYLKEKYS